MNWTLQIKLLVLPAYLSAILTLHPSQSVAWNIPTHMITGAIAYRILQSENSQAVLTVQSILKKHRWYADRWRTDLEALPESQREMLFMLAARWADEIRMKDRVRHRGPWHYINFPFRPNGETVEAKPPAAVNILTAISENERILRKEPNRRNERSH